MANKGMEHSGLNQVRADEKKGWGSVALIWAGSVVCVPALMVGGFITAGLNFAESAIAMFIGYAICVLFMTFMSIQSSDLGVPTVVAVSGAFGKSGSSYVISTIIAFCFTCWFGLQAAVCGDAFAGLLAPMGIRIPSWLSIVIWGIIMCVTAVFGINWMKYLNAVSVPALIIIIIYAIVSVLSNPDSAHEIVNYVPAGKTPMIAAIGMAVGGFAAGSVLSGDVTRYCKDRKSVVLSSIIGVIPMGVGTLLAGAVLAIHSGALGMDNANIVKMLESIGAPILGLLVLILATWTTNVSNAYSSGFALLNLTKAKDEKRPMLTLLAGIVGTLLAVFGILNYFGNFLNVLAAFIPPIAGVAIMDYFIIRKAKPENWKQIDGVNWAGLIAWVIGAVFALVLPNFLIPAVNAIVISSILYLILQPIIYKGKEAS